MQIRYMNTYISGSNRGFSFVSLFLWLWLTSINRGMLIFVNHRLWRHLLLLLLGLLLLLLLRLLLLLLLLLLIMLLLLRLLLLLLLRL